MTEDDKDDIAEAVQTWWPDPVTLERSGTRRAERAELRRCGDISSVVFCNGYQRLRAMLSDDDSWPDGEFEARAAVIAAVLSHVQEDHALDPPRTGDFATILGENQGNNKALMSGLRFRRLLHAREDEDLLMHMVRAVRLVGRRAPVYTLARDLCCWGQDDGDRVRRAWATRYYETAPQEA